MMVSGLCFGAKKTHKQARANKLHTHTTHSPPPHTTHKTGEGEVVVNTDFSLGYGGKILLHNTK